MLRKSQVRTVFILSLFFLSVSINWSQSVNDPATFFVPIVLAEGGAGGSNYSSELTLANRSDREGAGEFTYTSAFGQGDGTPKISLKPEHNALGPMPLLIFVNWALRFLSPAAKAGRFAFDSLG